MERRKNCPASGGARRREKRGTFLQGVRSRLGLLIGFHRLEFFLAHR